MANAMHGDWMLAYSHLPLGLKQAPQHSRPLMSPTVSFFSPFSTTLFLQNSKIRRQCGILGPMRRQFVKRAGHEVVAIQLTLDTDGFSYRKWGSLQRCKRGDWIVQNGGEVYSVDRDTFAHTYRELSPGMYRKVSPVWAERTDEAGSVATKEGVTHYPAGAYLVSNDAEGTDSYAVGAATFEAMYEPV